MINKILKKRLNGILMLKIDWRFKIWELWVLHSFWE